MATSNMSFWELIELNKVCIPIIQRDYAQGRTEESEKRERFLDSIFIHIDKNEKLHLDFVYGRIKNHVFYPIDGQQRLTTLFLLHWYFAIKEKIDTEKKSKLKRFVYDTRISSREFCKALAEENIEIPNKVGDDIFSNEIQRKYWFRASWNYDPTIKAMLIMIQAIHDKFYSINTPSVFNKLTLQKSITFEVLDLGSKDFELIDELYIKMNARGKQLTAFENFKANFIQLIDKFYKEKKLNHPIKGEISYSGYFSYKIEKEWTDLFWTYRADKVTIDLEFSNFFEYIAQMCYFKEKRDARADDFNISFKLYEEIFQQEDNLLFLFNSLDKIYELSVTNKAGAKENIEGFLEILFANGLTDNSIHPNVTLFWNTNDNISLFEKIIKKGRDNDARNKIMFYCLFDYLIKHNLSSVNDGIKDYCRVIRNLIQSTRQRNDTQYNTNMRINNFGNYWSVFKQLATKNVHETLLNQIIRTKGSLLNDYSFENERKKSTIITNNNHIVNELRGLEEFKYLGGLIHQIQPDVNYSKLKKYLKSISEIWEDALLDTIKIQALIVNGFEGLSIKDTSMGKSKYFGKKGNWDTILTCEDDDISRSIISLLDLYNRQTGNSSELRLKAIVDNWLKVNAIDRSWRYYFLKYPYFTSGKNYYAWINDFEIQMLGSESSNPLLAYHINPYVLTVCKIVNDNNICSEFDCYQQFTGNYPLVLKNGLTFKSTKDGWIIDNNATILTPKIISRYNLEFVDNNYLLKEITGKDRIETAVDFITNL